MGLGFFLLIVAIIVFISLQERVDLTCLNRDYEDWKNNRR